MSPSSPIFDSSRVGGSAARTDEAWRAALLAHDETAWRDLSRHLYTWIVNYLYQNQGWRSEDGQVDLALEYTQRAGVRIVERLAAYRGEGSFLGWCRSVTIHLLIDETRRDIRRRRRETTVSTLSADPADDPYPQLVDTLLLDTILDRLEQCSHEHLSAQEERVFTALAAQEETPAEIADALKLARNYVDQIWFRARKKIRRCLEENGYSLDTLKQLEVL